MSDDLSRRIDTLEIRFTEQEAQIEDLNATITAQWRIIDALKREFERLADRVESEAAAQGVARDERPPHY